METSLLVERGPDEKYGAWGVTRERLALDAYQSEAARLAKCPDKRTGPLIFLGLAGEAAEVIDTFLSDQWNRIITINELGDVLWYVAAICDQLGVRMSDLDIRRSPGENPSISLIAACHIVTHAGRVAEHAKKAIRDDDGEFTEPRKAHVFEQLGQVVAYVEFTARLMGVSLEEVLSGNLSKLQAIADKKAGG